MPKLRVVVLALALCGAAHAANTYTVNSTLDTDDADDTDGICDDGAGHCTLRAAITQANHDAAADTISFGVGTGPIQIPIASPLPVTQPLTIDGTSQPGFASPAPAVELVGTGESYSGLVVTAACTISTLSLHGFSTAIDLQSGASVLTGNYIGLDPGGNTAANSVGVHVAASSVVIGGSSDDKRNLISGNGKGIFVESGGSSVVIRRNWLGVDPAGSLARANQLAILLSGCDGATVDLNLISGSTAAALALDGATNAVVTGNLVGTDAAGSAAITNLEGVLFDDGASGNRLGGTSAAERNVITVEVVGVLLSNNSHDNVIEGNYVGTSAAGTAGLCNGGSGLSVSGGAHDNQVGGSVAGAGNVLSGCFKGLAILGSGSGNHYWGNWIGLSADGTSPIANTFGVSLGDPNITIGGSSAGQGNVISGNATGIQVSASSSGGAQVLGNFIGTDPSGTTAVPNVNGISFQGGKGLTIGSPGAGMNVISGNSSSGISFQSSGNDTVISGNYIGTDVTGGAALANATGVNLTANVTNVQVTNNLVSGNSGSGITVAGGTTSGHTITGNLIGTNASGTLALGNSVGIQIGGNTGQNITSLQIGGAGALANVIAFNALQGIRAAAGSGNRFQQNSIHDNGALGIDLSGSASSGDGVTANDVLDADTGANGFQNYPVLAGAVTNGGILYVAGGLGSKVSASYTIELFSSASCDASGFGEGQRFLGAFDVSTDVSGLVSFASPLPSPLPNGTSITATASGSEGTSEFSACVTSSPCPTAVVAPSSVPDGVVGSPYDRMFVASGAFANYSLAVPTPPPGLTLAGLALGGALSGTPTTAGSFPFDVVVTDSAGCQSNANLSLTVACPTIAVSPSPLPDGAVGDAYAQTLVASGGTAPYAFMVASGSLPDGLSLGSNGTLAGTPTTSGDFSVTIAVADAYGCRGQLADALTIGAFSVGDGGSSDAGSARDLSSKPAGDLAHPAPDFALVGPGSSSSDCGCRVGGAAAPTAAPWLFLFAAALVFGWRRRRLRS